MHEFPPGEDYGMGHGGVEVVAFGLAAVAAWFVLGHRFLIG
jgi:hypothetical protein